MSCCQALHIFDDVNFCMCGLIWLISHSLAVLFDSCVFVQPALITEKAQMIAGFPAVNRRSSSTMLFFWSECIFARTGKALQDLFCYLMTKHYYC